MIDTSLEKYEEDLREQISGLQKLVKNTKKTHEQRSNDLRESYIRLWNQTEALKQMNFELTQRMDRLEDSMGYRN